ncbi:MAG: hypothetical protein PHO91_03890 [Patescibacteria group bacterium]|nr:hypothetical protein [Patescibacteria group bacterium]
MSKRASKNLEQAIIKTLAFFDIFNYPLTELEIYKWLYAPKKHYSLGEISSALSTSDFLRSQLSLQEGFYNLKGRDHIYLQRKQNNNLAERKFRRARTLAKIYRFIPFVRMIAVCNSLAYSNAKESSDIDFFIISRKNTIWLARFFTILFIKFLGLRPEPDDKQDSFCLSFFVDEGDLNIFSSRLGENDIYYPYWVASLLPIYNPDGLYEKFLAANSWYKDYLPHSYPNQFAKETESTFWSKTVGKIIFGLFTLPIWRQPLYSYLRQMQIKIIGNNLKELVNVDSRVIVSESMLKFYPNDNRGLFARQWQEKTDSLLN